MRTCPNAAGADAFRRLADMLDPKGLCDHVQAKIPLAAYMHAETSTAHCRLIAGMLAATWSSEIKGTDFLEFPAFGKMWSGILDTPIRAAVTIQRLHDTRSLMWAVEEALDLPRSAVVAEWLPIDVPGGHHNLHSSAAMTAILTEKEDA